MIYTDTASEVAQNIAKTMTPPPPPAPSPDENLNAIQQSTGGNPGGISPPLPPSLQDRLDFVNRLRSVGPQFVQHAQQGAQAADQYNATHLIQPYAPNSGVYQNPGSAEMAQELARANPQFGVAPTQNAFQSISSVLNTPAQVTGGLLNAGLQPLVSKLPQSIGPVPVRAPAQTATSFAANTVPYVAADVATGGALTPVYGAQAGLQAAAIGQSYQRGEIDGKTALEQIGMNVGPFLVAPALHAAGAGARALADYAASPEGQQVLTHLASERGSLGIPPEPPEGEQPSPSEAGTGGAVLPAADNLPPPPEAAHAASTQAALEAMPQPSTVERTPNREAAGIENITHSPQEVAQAAVGFGASPQDALQLSRALQNAESATRNPDELLSAGKMRQRVAGTVAGVTGKLPGQMGDLAAIDLRFRNYLDVSMERAMPLVKQANTLITRDLGKIDNNLRATVYEHPDQFTLKPDTLAAIQKAADAGPKYGLLRAVDPTSAQNVSGNYLAQIYQGEDTSPLAPPVRAQRGETGVAESRKYPDRRVAIANGETMKDMTLPELYAASYRRTNQAIQDATFRKNVLQNFATTDKPTADANGWKAITNPVFTRPEEGPWYAPQPIKNMIDQRYKSSGGVMQTAANVTAKGKAVMMVPGDVGGIINRIKTLGLQKPEAILAGMLHDALTTNDPAKEAQFAADGLKGARGGSLAAESSVTPGANLYSQVTGAPWKLVGKMSEWAHEGNILIGQALGTDMSPDTEAGMRNRQASADEVNTTRLASRGAQIESRNTAERVALLSQQTTRALFSRVGQVGQLLSPSSTPYQRFLAAQGLMHWAIATWGTASLARMAFGGKPAPFPVSWDSQTNQFKYNSDWYMAKVGGYAIPTTADVGLANALIKSATVIANAAANPSTSSPADIAGEAVKPLTQFGIGRLGPLTRAAPALAGIGYTPEGTFSTRMTAGQRIAAALPQPISVSRVIQNPNVLSDPKALAQEQLLGGFPPSPSQPFFDARDALNQSGFPTGTLTDQQQKTLGSVSTGATLAAQRAAFASKWTTFYMTHDQSGKPLQNQVSALEAKRVASARFDAYSTVKSVQHELTTAEHTWAQKNPYVLLQAVQAGNVIPDAYEKTVVAWARAHPQQSPTQ